MPEAQGHGAGRALVNETLHGLYARGHAAAFLWVLDANAPARRFREALGFALDGRRHDFALGGSAFAEVRYPDRPLTAPAIRPRGVHGRMTSGSPGGRGGPGQRQGRRLATVAPAGGVRWERARRAV